ncbi:MAG TPA: ABC transporter permease subunit [Gemmataceae bacterium]|jgi:sodium transport system permease protein|nr:ABC transporter permease subunit [Gemmataceae bacterium]
MRRSVVRLIAKREIRDLLRDRRTLLIVLGLPALLYPAFVIVGLAFAISMMDQKTVIGVAGMEHLPAHQVHPEALLAGAALAVEADRKWDDPALFVDGKFNTKFLKADATAGTLVVHPLANGDRGPLDERKVDAILVIPPNVMTGIDGTPKPEIRILGRDGDETSKLAVARLNGVVGRWRERVKAVRFVRRGLPADFDEPVAIIDPDDAKPLETKTADELRDVFVKFLPFLLVMWTMAGALHPAIDLTAGEKERGTMETLLICPAGRTEIVAGKFLAVWVFSYAGALWNLFWMAAGALFLGVLLPSPVLSFAGLGWAALLAIPLAALFSSLALGLGAFARSTKEGQYYLLPLMVLTLPLSMYALAPGLKLTPVLAAIPVSGLSLILQNLLAVSGEPITPLSWVLGVGSLVVCVGLALTWASWQFRREAVLFRGEEGLSLRAWWRILTERE